jgi:prepilin-type N-terminal cleavage/methylation domain-containing protein
MSTSRKEDGFTLIEVLVSLVLLSITMLVFFTVFQRYALVSVKNEDEIIAMNLARNTLVRLQENSDYIKPNFYDNEQYFDIDNHLLNNQFFTNWISVEKKQSVQDIPYYVYSTVAADYYITIKNVVPIGSKEPKDNYSLQTILIKIYKSDELKDEVAEIYGYLDE